MEENICKREPTRFTSSSGFDLLCFKKGPSLPNFHMCKGNTFELKKKRLLLKP